MSRKSVVGLLILVLLGLSGCGALGVREDPAPAGGPHGRVDTSGFTISAGDVTVSGPSGVAPEGTRVTMTLVEAPPDLVQLELNGSPLFDIALEGDAQPAVPVTVTWPVPAQMAADSIAFVTADGPGSPWRGIPVTVQNGLASVEMDHFSWGWFVDGQSIINNFRDAASGYFGQHHEAPPNCRPTALVGVSEATVQATREDYVHACVTAEDGRAAVTAASNSPHGFRVKIQDKAIVRNIIAGPSLESAVTLAVSRRMLREDEDAVLVPGGRVEVAYSPSDWTGHPDVQVIGGSGDAAFGLIPIALVGVQMFTTEVPSELADDAATIECLVSIMDGIGADSASSWGGAIPGLVGCVATAMDDGSGRLGLISAITTSLAGHLVTQVRGIVDTASGLTFAVTANTRIPSVNDLSAYRLEAAGLGPLRIGTSMSQVLENGWGTRSTDGCTRWVTANRISNQDVHIDSSTYDRTDLAAVTVRSRKILTVSGARVGMTLAQLRSVYGNRLQSEIKNTSGGPLRVHFVTSGQHEIYFWFGPVGDGHTTIESMTARRHSKDLFSGC